VGHLLHELNSALLYDMLIALSHHIHTGTSAVHQLSYLAEQLNLIYSLPVIVVTGSGLVSWLEHRLQATSTSILSTTSFSRRSNCRFYFIRCLFEHLCCGKPDD